MPDTVSELQIEINAKAVKANDAIDRLVGKLDRLTTSLGQINGTNLNGLANGVQRLGNAMQVMNTIKTADFTRLATNLTKLGTVNVSALNSAASSMSHLTRAFNGLGTVSSNAVTVGELAKNIAKLGNKSVQTAITNIPQLAKAMNNLMATLSKAPRVNQNVIQMTNALANLASQGSKVGTASNSIVRGLNRTSTSANTAKKSFSGLASAIGKFYATYFLVIRGLKGLWSSIESTADYIEAYNYFNVALGKIGSDWSYQFEKYGYDNAESYAESFSTRLSENLGKLSGLQVSIGADGKGLLTESGMKNLGLNIQEITQYASQLASVTNSVGQTGEVSLAAASSFSKLAGDISSLFNVDYSSVSKNLQSALIGQSRAVYKYGLDITQATLQTYAYNLGLSKSVSEMTQAEKMQLRMLAILDQSKVSWGDLANTINSPSNMIRQFTNNLKETGMVLGQLFIPILQKVLPVINGVTIAIKRLLVNLANLFGIKIDFDAFGQGYSDMEDGIEDVSSAFDDATSAAKKFKSVTLGIDELNINAPQEDTGKGAVGVSGGIDLTDEILKATEEYENVWNQAYEQMENRAQEFADKLENIFKTRDFDSIGRYISNSIANGLNSINWDSVYRGARNFGTGLADFLNGLISPELFGTLGSTIAKSLNTVLYSAIAFGETFDFKNLGVSIATGINNFFRDFDFRALARTINLWVDGLKETLITAIKNIDWGNVIKGAIEFVDELEFDTLAIIIGAIAFTFKRGAIGKAISDLGSTIIGYLTLRNFGGNIIQFLKMDITSSITMGTLSSAGTAIGASLIAGVTAAIAGFKFGQYIYEKWIEGTDWDAFGYDYFHQKELEEQAIEVSKTIENAGSIWNESIGIVAENLDWEALFKFEGTEEWAKTVEHMNVALMELGERNIDISNASTAMEDLDYWLGNLDHNARSYVQILLEQYDNLDANTKAMLEQKYGIEMITDGLTEQEIAQARLNAQTEGAIAMSGKYAQATNTSVQSSNGARLAFLEQRYGLQALNEELAVNNVLQSTSTRAVDATKEAVSQYIEEQRRALGIVDETTLGYENFLTSLNNTSLSFDEFKSYIETLSNEDMPYIIENLQLFDENVSVLRESLPLLKNEFKNTFDYIKKEVGITTDKFNNDFFSIFSKDNINSVLSSVPTVFETVFKNTANIVIDIFNSMIDSINNSMNISWDAINVNGKEVVSAGSATLLTIPNIPRFELGGFPEDGWFRASRGEIMGQFDNGQSVVANNMQIVEGISSGVREAVSEVLVPYLSDISRNTREAADKDMSVNIGDRDIARANARGSRLIGNFIVT